MKTRTDEVEGLVYRRNQLSNRKAEITWERKKLKTRQKETARRLSNLDMELIDIAKEQESISGSLTNLKREPFVTDHAVVRYLERVKEMDIEAIREKLMTETVKLAIESGAKSVKVDGMKLIIQDNCIVTVV